MHDNVIAAGGEIDVMDLGDYNPITLNAGIDVNPSANTIKVVVIDTIADDDVYGLRLHLDVYGTATLVHLGSSVLAGNNFGVNFAASTMVAS